MYYAAIFISHKPDGVSWASAGMGKGALGPQNVVKCFVLQMFSKLSLSGRSIDALFWENVVSFCGLRPRPPPPPGPHWGLPSFRPLLPTPGKILRASMRSVIISRPIIWGIGWALLQ